MKGRPLWLVAGLAIQLTAALGLLAAVTVNTISSKRELGLPVTGEDFGFILFDALPLVLAAGLAALAWRLWGDGRRRFAAMLALLPVVLIVALIFVAAMLVRYP